MNTQVQITQALEIINPVLKKDNGGIRFVKLITDHIAEFEFFGDCVKCPLKVMTFRAGVEPVIKQYCPQITRIECKNLT